MGNKRHDRRAASGELGSPTPASSAESPPPADPQQDRRGFVKFIAVAVGSIVSLVPLAAGLATFVTPLVRRARRADGKADDSDMVIVATRDSLPEDGQPVAFPFIDDRVDAWNLFPPSKIGMVYVRRVEGKERDGVEVFTATCPHLGCMVDYKQDRRVFQCPCHQSYFQPNGQRINPAHCPSPRNLDRLDHFVTTAGEIRVRFERFRAGIPDKQLE